MKRVKLFSAINFSDDWDSFQKIGEAISEWTEISDEEFGTLEKHRYAIECDLKLKKVLFAMVKVLVFLVINLRNILTCLMISWLLLRRLHVMLL